MGDATETRGDLRPAGSGQLYGSPRRRSTRGRNRRGELRMPDADPAGRSPLRFFLLVFLLTVPFLVLGALNDGQIVPGVPLAGLAVVCPVLAALVLEYRRDRGAGVRALLSRSFDARRITHKVWYLPTLLLYPAVLVLSFVILRL